MIQASIVPYLMNCISYTFGSPNTPSPPLNYLIGGHVNANSSVYMTHIVQNLDPPIVDRPRPRFYLIYSKVSAMGTIASWEEKKAVDLPVFQLMPASRRDLHSKPGLDQVPSESVQLANLVPSLVLLLWVLAILCECAKSDKVC